MCKCPTLDCQDATARPLRFAPGVLEAHKVGLLGSPSQRRQLLRWARQLAAFGAVLVVAAFAVGLIAGRLP